MFDGLLLLGPALSQEIGAAFFVFLDPGFGEAAIADFREELLHGFAGLRGDDARTGMIVAVLGGIADGITHVAEATAVNQIDDELEFVETFEVGNFRLIAGIDEGFETGLN